MFQMFQNKPSDSHTDVRTLQLGKNISPISAWWVLQVLIGTIENGCLGVAALLLVTQKRCACRHEAKTGSQKVGKCDCDVQSEPITCDSAADCFATLIPIHGTTSWPLEINDRWWDLKRCSVSRPNHWKWLQISKRVEWGGCKFWISKRTSSSRLNLNQPWIVSEFLSYIYYICILGCSVL